MSDLLLQAAMSRRRLEAEQDVTRQWIERSQNQDQTISELQKQVLLLRMCSAGLLAQRDFLRESPDHIEKSKALTNEAKKDGSPKTFFRKIYDDAFDKKGIELNIANPAEWRD